MPTVDFTAALVRHVGQVPSATVHASTVREALDAVFSEHPRLRAYVLDDQDALRQHVAVFVDGRTVTDRQTLADPVSPAGRIHVLQALSGG